MHGPMNIKLMYRRFA